jgi:hypothetical protein
MVFALLIYAVLASQSTTCQGTTNDGALRDRAIQTVDPIYPSDAIKSHISGIVVVDLCVPVGSETATFVVSVAPSSSIRNAVITAMEKWRFKSPEVWFENSPVHSYGGTIIFYFVQQKAVWRVLSPTESFFVGPRFDRSSGEW